MCFRVLHLSAQLKHIISCVLGGGGHRGQHQIFYFDQIIIHIILLFNYLFQKVTTKLHPDTVLHMVNLLTTLIHSCHVLDWADSKDQALQDILELFNR